MPAPGDPSRWNARSARRSCSRTRRASSRATTSRPAFGLQFFGHVAIDGATEAMTVTLKDVADRALWSITLEPKPPAPARVSLLRLYACL